MSNVAKVHLAAYTAKAANVLKSKFKDMDKVQELTLSATQARVYDALHKFINSNERYITLGGLAGTGKTTIISRFISEISDGFKISTIHRLIYRPETDEDGKIKEWKFSPRYIPDVLVIDEASMVPEDIFDDLLSLGSKIIFVGDHGQLPPISKSNFNLMKEPDLVIEEIHRQALDSPIIQIADMARKGEYIPFKRFSDKVMKVRSVNDLPLGDLLSDPKMYFLITDTNRRRVRLNQVMMQALGFDRKSTKIGAAPAEGSRVICLRNCYEVNPMMYNGMLATITKSEYCDGESVFLAVEDDVGNTWENLQVPTYMFNMASANTKIARAVLMRFQHIFDYGYALTCHKAQGSQAKRVLVFGTGFGKPEERRRWLYTAVTRAEEELYICGDKL